MRSIAGHGLVTTWKPPEPSGTDSPASRRPRILHTLADPELAGRLAFAQMDQHEHGLLNGIEPTPDVSGGPAVAAVRPATYLSG
ncbi:hypothetical protein [Sinosporangium siamense]|uniref:Uncharacterized protein n=1 Tax=Sinosporangium siamense TaxID=1367973 RepID=A0A919RFF7_9ACTN|nr:hypothetical protein Ssi02_31510 [Sinosporangium siamense]